MLSLSTSLLAQIKIARLRQAAIAIDNIVVLSNTQSYNCSQIFIQSSILLIFLKSYYNCQTTILCLSLNLPTIVYTLPIIILKIHCKCHTIALEISCNM